MQQKSAYSVERQIYRHRLQGLRRSWTTSSYDVLSIPGCSRIAGPSRAVFESHGLSAENLRGAVLFGVIDAVATGLIWTRRVFLSTTTSLLLDVLHNGAQAESGIR